MRFIIKYIGSKAAPEVQYHLYLHVQPLGSFKTERVLLGTFPSRQAAANEITDMVRKAGVHYEYREFTNIGDVN